jgi:hypothetical protein
VDDFVRSDLAECRIGLPQITRSGTFSTCSELGLALEKPAETWDRVFDQHMRCAPIADSCEFESDIRASYHCVPRKTRLRCLTPWP